MKINLEIARKAIALETGAIGNGVLYRLCKDYPCHDNPDAINAKVWLIGRSYAAAIERRKKYRNEPNDDFYKNRVVRMIRESKIDQKLSTLKKYSFITEDNIPYILEVHNYLLDIFKKISGLEKRSLASKYLHFHFRNLFFIYDSRAKSALLKISEKPKQFEHIISDNPRVDKEYADFFYRSFITKSKLENKLREKMSPRQFDNMLIMIKNDELRN